jgi:TM2 domain-containing membrane protein YozV
MTIKDKIIFWLKLSFPIIIVITVFVLWIWVVVSFVEKIGKQVDEHGGLKAVAERLWYGKGVDNAISK